MIGTRLGELGIQLPQPVTPVGSYVPATRIGSVVGTSGQLPITSSGDLISGRLGDGLDVEEGSEAARVAAINALAAAADAAGGIDEISRIVRVVCYVNSDPEFTEQAAVANGASDVLGEIFGDQGRHIRSAVGVATLPKNAAVEVELFVEVR